MSTSIVFSAELWGNFKKKQDVFREIKEKYAVNIENPNVSANTTFIHLHVQGNSAKSLSAKEKLIADFELFNKPKPPKAPSQKSRRSTDVLVSIGKWEKYKDEYRALGREHDVDLNSSAGSTNDFRVVQIQPRMNARLDVQSVRDLILKRVESSPYSNVFADVASKSQPNVDQWHDVSDINKQHVRQQTGKQDSTIEQTPTRVYQYQHTGTEKDHFGIYADHGTHDSNMPNLDNEAMWKGRQTDRNIARDIIRTQAVANFTTDMQAGNGSDISNESSRSNVGITPDLYTSVDGVDQLRPSSNAHLRGEQPYTKAISGTPEHFRSGSGNHGQYSGSEYAVQSKVPQTERRNFSGISFEDQPIDIQLFIEANKEAYNEFNKTYKHKMTMFRRDDQGHQMLSLYIYDKKDETLRPKMNSNISKMYKKYKTYIELRQRGLKIEREEFLKINKVGYSKFQKRYANRVSIVQPDKDLLFIEIHNHKDEVLRPTITEQVMGMYDAYLDKMGTPV